MATKHELTKSRDARMREVLPPRFEMLSDQPQMVLSANSLLGESGNWRWWSSASRVSNIGSGVFRQRQLGRIDLFAESQKQKRGALSYAIRGMRDECAYFECVIKPSNPDAEIWWSIGKGGSTQRNRAAAVPTTNNFFIYYFGTEFLPKIVGSRTFALWQGTPATGSRKIWSLEKISVYFGRKV